MGKVLKAVHFNSGFRPAFLENLLIFFILQLEIKHSTKAFCSMSNVVTVSMVYFTHKQKGKQRKFNTRFAVVD